MHAWYYTYRLILMKYVYNNYYNIRCEIISNDRIGNTRITTPPPADVRSRNTNSEILKQARCKETNFSLSTSHLDTRSVDDTGKKREIPTSEATDLARYVFPVPGACTAQLINKTVL